jgi:hypothetical protein
LSTEEVSEHIYQSIGDNSDSSLSGGQNIDPISVETGSIIPSDLLEGEESSPYIGSDEYNKIIPDSDLKDDAPCRVEDSHKEYDPEQFLADKSNFPEPPATPSNQGFFASLFFTKVSQFFILLSQILNLGIVLKISLNTKILLPVIISF